MPGRMHTSQQRQHTMHGGPSFGRMVSCCHQSPCFPCRDGEEARSEHAYDCAASPIRSLRRWGGAESEGMKNNEAAQVSRRSESSRLPLPSCVTAANTTDPRHEQCNV